jgi:ferredoxin
MLGMGDKGDEIAAYAIDDPRELIAALQARGLRVIGPHARAGAIALAPYETADALPRGLVDIQAPGRYRLEPGDPERWFDYVVGPQGWKPWLYPSRRRLWSARRGEGEISVAEDAPETAPTAFFGVRPCELAAIARLDAVFRDGPFPDPDYTARRKATTIVVVQCARAAKTCFCASMATGPRASSGFDLALTELEPGAGHRFLLEVASTDGAEIAAALAAAPATPAQRAAASAATETAEAMQVRRMADGVADGLKARPEHPHWDSVAQRCLSCANCTLACPTCFCSDVEDTTDLTGAEAERWRVWDSCFTTDFSRLAEGPARASTRSRYRQWMTHKLSTWHDQFDMSGCVGCGRCVTWCPVGIDITAEAAALMEEAEP